MCSHHNYTATCLKRTVKCSIPLWAIPALIILVNIFASCKKNQLFSPGSYNAPLVFRASDSAIVLNQSNEYNAAITFNWTTGSNHQTSSSISYILQIDKKGNNFHTAIVNNVGTQIYSLSYTTGRLNDSLLNRWKAFPDTAVQLEARIIAIVGDSVIAPDTSNVLSFTVTPYQPVSSTLYIIGDATSSGWNANDAEPLTPDQSIPGLFHYQGLLIPGHFKFITISGSFLPSYNEGADNQHVVLRTSYSQPDNQFLIYTAGVYAVNVNLIADTISYQQLAQPAYSQLWIVGDATPNGWNINNPNQMFRDPDNHFIFKYDEVLNVGEFKIPVTTGNWGCAFYRPYSNHPPIADDSVQLVQPRGGPADANDYKWYIPTAGPYKIILNLLTPSISIVPFQPYTKLWILGDATPNGWNINSPTQMTPDPNNPYIFTYTGHLNVGEFKIPIATGNFGTDYFRPYSNHPPISDTTCQFVPVNGGPADANDYKWYISTAGNYTVTLDQLHETIKIKMQ
ncbi:MAG: SusF/SusE family outer membrane protein [Chitinophagaceae bacterium]|nr:MAG: SusF/SusE family outer membrane protein [Chitinophagaceae bacterium]